MYKSITLIYSASVLVESNAKSSDSMVLLEINVCLVDFQDTAAPPNKNTYPVVDLTSEKSPIQLASL